MAEKKDKNESAQPVGYNPKAVQLGGESLVERLIPHMKKIAIALGIGAAIVSVVFLVRWRIEVGREKKTAKLATALDVAAREVRAAGSPPDPKAKEPTFANNKERADAVLSALAQADNTPSPYKASLLIQSGKLDDAIAEYRKHQNDKALDGVLAREGLGIALETKATQQKDAAARQKGLEEALSVFKGMQPDEKGPRYAYALYHQGRILALLGKNADAKAAFEKAKSAGTEEKLPELIDQRLASLGGA